MRLNRWLILLGAIILIVILGLAGLFKPVGNLIQTITLPVVSQLTRATEYVFDSAPESEKDAHIQDLESRLNNMTVDYVHLKALEEENRSLRAQAQFLETSGYDSVGARVIGRERQNGRSLLLVDRGSSDNVEIGQAVIAEEGIFIGKISQIRDRVATVELFTDPQSRVAASLQGNESLIGVVEGRGNGALALTFIPSGTEMSRDEIVVTAGTEEHVPGHLPLGVVNVVEGKPNDPFLEASIEPLLDLERVVFVNILRPAALRPRL
ncbi:hypothetical protein COX00_02980 [Candidatus Uhrbacteria bacterium CG22_combo_CG10-13_8_21_14_all_47_17]|uniref:Cell shape-determining protein MreC n=1 Tax=Candidatus Uhrbacteria bacterium CG22_combo_CG10-13_8_21_14_all_47_17 TaxID=1975041 RepID=A0A2H0BS36_9BACT|nr:MAG: hypothetical protein COX00_02980 [Candidatus Uhrbacteria bacterium CG22_combo_CG10-13_8_21_14_all_47_17]